MTNPLGNVPSWFIGVLGASLIVLSTVVGATILDWLGDNIRKNTDEVEQLKGLQRDLVEAHTVTSPLIVASGQFLGLSKMGDGVPDTSEKMTMSSRSFLLEQASSYALDAMQTKLVAARLYRTHAEIDKDRQLTRGLAENLKLGNVETYNEIRRFMRAETVRAAEALNALRSKLKHLRTEIAADESRHGHYRTLQIALNLLGLAIVLLKDLPIWRTNRL